LDVCVDAYESASEVNSSKRDATIPVVVLGINSVNESLLFSLPFDPPAFF
jgi:hypothetical protein